MDVIGRRVVLVGGGAAGRSCAQHLRTLRDDVEITILDSDLDAPYDRPPLSKDVLSGTVDGNALIDRNRRELHARRIQLINAQVERLDPQVHVVCTDDDRRIEYDDLVIAPGCRPVIPWPGVAGQIQNVHSMRDVTLLRRRLIHGARVTIVGAGLVGLEVAAVLRELGHPVTVIEAEQHPLERVIGRDASEAMEALHRSNGVDFLLGRRVRDLRVHGSVVTVQLEDDTTLDCSTVLVGVGVRPATAWLVGSGVELGAQSEIVADQFLRTALDEVWAAGDAVSWPSALFGARRRIEHWSCAKEQGRYVAERIAKQGVRGALAFDTLPYFWSMQYGRMLQGAGDVFTSDVRLERDTRVHGRFTARYFSAGQLAGVVCFDDPRTFLTLRQELQGSRGTART